MSISPEDLRRLCPCFRVLIMGRRNAGKTTILEKMAGVDAGTKPEVYDKEGNRVKDYDSLLKPGLERGMSMLEYEIKYDSNPYFVFHDSRGIEAGAESDESSELRIERIQAFILDRASKSLLRDQLHAIWFCIPMDNPRVPSEELELAFFNKGNGKVPVIAVLTKYEALVTRAKEHFKGSLTKEQRFAYTKKNVLDPLQKTNFPPLSYVTIHDHGKGCNLLAEKTHQAMKDDTIADIFALAQQASMKVGCQIGFRKVLCQGLVSKLKQATDLEETRLLVRNVVEWVPFWLFYHREVNDLNRNRDYDHDDDLRREDAAVELIMSKSMSWSQCHHIQYLVMVTRLQFITFVYILACAMSKRSKKPWTICHDVIDPIESQVEFRDNVLKQVDQVVQMGFSEGELCMQLAEIVLSSVSAIS